MANIFIVNVRQLAPSIHGEPHIKTAIALSMFGGEAKSAVGGHRIRGDLNILILGDPGNLQAERAASCAYVLYANSSKQLQGLVRYGEITVFEIR